MVELSKPDPVKHLSNFTTTAPPFVGRRAELTWLENILQEVLAGQPRVVLLLGEAGIGKTRLLQELRSDALRHGLQVGYGRGYEDLTLPYLPFVEALRTLLDGIPHDLERTLGKDAEAIEWLLHREQAATRVASPFTSTQNDQDKLRLFFAVSRTAMSLAQRSPTILILDDLHWADRSSIDLLGHLVFTVADSAKREPVPLLIINSYRPVEAETHLGRLIARLERELVCRTFTLPGLNETEIHELVQGFGLPRPSHQLVVTVSEATQGNPLFIQEVVHHLVQRDALRERGGYVMATADPADLRLPEQVTGAIVSRTQHISEACRRVLTLASFLGDRFSLGGLAAASTVGEDEVLNLLEDGIRQRLLLSEGEAFRFAHPLIRHVFYHEPSPARRQRIHLQLAETLECLHAANLDAHVLEIAHHLIRAGSAAESTKVMAYAWRAGDQAFKLFAWGEAAYYYEAALTAAESNAQLPLLEQAELHYWAGLARQWDEDVGPCLHHYEKAIAAYRLAGDIRGLARALMERTRVHYTVASVPLGSLADVQPLEEVLKTLGDSEPRLRGHIAAIVAEAYRNARQADKAKEMARQALEIGQRLQDDHLSARASFALGLAHINGLSVKEALEDWQNALVYAMRADNPILQGWPLQRMPLALVLLGRLDEAEAIALEACELPRKTHNWGDYSVALSHLASIAAARGDFAAAERWTYETMLMVERSRYPWGGLRALCALACSRVLRGAWAEAEDALGTLVMPGRVFEDAGAIIQAFAQVFRKLVQAHAGTGDDATEQAVADLISVVRTDTYSLAPLCASVELGDLLANPAMTEQPYEALSMAARRGVLFTSGWMFLIPRLLGVARALNRRWDMAEAHFHTAVDVATTARARPELGRTYQDYARMLVARGRKSDRRRAIKLIGQAGLIFQELAMEPFTRRAVKLAEALGDQIPLVPHPRVVYPNDLSEQEREIVLRTAGGRTAQEIAEPLVIGSKAVARHRHNILNKIGVKGPAETAAYALEMGLASQIRPRSDVEATSAHERSPRGDNEQSLRIILVTDIVGSAALIQRWGDAEAHECLRIHNSITRDCLHAYHGTEITHTGNGIEASFPSASSAVEYAIAVQKAFVKHNQECPHSPIRVRMGIHAGEPIPTEGRLFGTAVHVTFRICIRAQPGQILVSDVVRQLASGKSFVFVDRGRVTLKGMAGRFRLYEACWEGERLS